MGGAIAMDYQLNYTQELKAIILVATGGRLRVSPKFLDQYAHCEDMPQMTNNLYGSDISDVMAKDEVNSKKDVSNEVWYADFTACDKFDILDQLHKISVPVLVLCGAEDQMTPPKYSYYLKEKIPGAKMELFAGSGHMLMTEIPQDFNRVIKGFLCKPDY